MQVEDVYTRERLITSVEEQIESASHEILIGTFPEVYEEIEDTLAEAYANGVFIALCLYTDPQEAGAYDFEQTATLVRAWDQELDTLLTVDQQTGVIGMPKEDETDEEEVLGLEFDTDRLYGLAFMQFMSQHWDEGEEVYITDARSLPYETANLRDAALNAALHLREGNAVGFRARVREAPAEEDSTWETIDGQLTTVRQSFVEPSTNSFFGEIGLVAYIDEEGRVSMGGHGAYFEDYEATDIVLTPV
ncbi:MAG: TrmB family transcriptional regulator sugar-binding domain-containing protein [Halapricum sp.]